MIQERFYELQPYLKGVKLAGNYTMVESILKSNWKIDSILDDDEKIGVKPGKESEDNKGYINYLLYSEEKTIDELINALEIVVNTNIENEQKQALLRSKVEELKRMFEDKSLDELKGLKFSSEMDVTLKIKKPEPEQIIKEGEDPKKTNVVTEKI